MSVRAMATDPIDPKKAAANAAENLKTHAAKLQRTALSLKEQLLSPLGITAMGGIVAFTLAFEVSSMMSGISLWDMGEYAFWAGVGTTVLLGSTVLTGWQSFGVRPDLAAAHALRIAKKHPEAARLLNSSTIRTGNFRAFQLLTHAAAQAQGISDSSVLPKTGLVSWNRVFRPSTFQIMFTVRGGGQDGKLGVISAQVRKQGLHYSYDTLYITSLADNEKVQLEGHDSLSLFEKRIKFLDTAEL